MACLLEFEMFKLSLFAWRYQLFRTKEMFFSFFKKKACSEGKERRIAPRQERVFIAQCESEGKKSFTTIVNLSSGGMGAFLEKEMQPGSEILITLQHEFVRGSYDAKKINLALKVKIMWIKEGQPEKGLPIPDSNERLFKAGLELVSNSQEIVGLYQKLLEA